MSEVIVKVSTSKNVNVTASIPAPISITTVQATPLKEIHKQDKFTATAGQTDFTLSFAPRTKSWGAFKNGIFINDEVSIVGQVMTINACDLGDKIEVDYVLD